MPRLRTIATAAAALALLATATTPAAWAAGENYPEWTLDGDAGAYTGTVAVDNNFPGATFTSDARSPASLVSGSTAWLPEDSPFGADFGSSRDRPYLLLRPAADNATSPSTTTYTFDSPTPTSGWGFALGDIDADEVTISATDPAGNPAPVADLGFQSAFNICDTTATRPPTCSGVTAPYDLPTWDPTTATLTGNPTATDATGGTGWFKPTAPLATLTFTFRWRSGFPVYQTWFASLPQPTPEPTNSDGVQPVDNIGPAKPALAATGSSTLVVALGVGFGLLAIGLTALVVCRLMFQRFRHRGQQ